MYLIFPAILLLLFGGQLYWILRARKWIRTRRCRVIVLAVYGVWFAFNFHWLGRGPSPTHMTVAQALLAAPFLWWVFGSSLAALLAGLLWPVRRAAANPGLVSPERRQFLEHAVSAVTAVPFVAGGYGLLYGRLNLETTSRTIRLTSLPKVFHGFRIAQLSDIHIGPFMGENEIRKYVQIANELKPDLMVITGDYVTWDPSTQKAVVNALRGLKAPFGVFGCLGNHELWTGTEDSITLLFEQAGIRILRQARVPITNAGEFVNLIGIDYAARGRAFPDLDKLAARGVPNILLSHNPNTFDRAAAAGIDFSLAGHTHGGQVALEFVSPKIAPSRLITPYVAGWFEKAGGQLYVNRGIGTIGVPIRVGAPPEISVFELA